MSHIYLSVANRKELLGEYVYYLLEQRGGFKNIKQNLAKYIYTKLGKSKNIKKLDFITNLSVQDFNYLLNEHLKYKLQGKNKKFDSFTLPSVLTDNQFKNRSPLEIREEGEDSSYLLIEDILRKGFPVAVGEDLYIFYMGEVPIDIYQKFYQEKRDLSHSTTISLSYSNKQKDVKIFMLEDRDYFNSLLFIYSLVGVLKEPEIKKYQLENKISRVVVWKKTEGGGSFFEITNLSFVLKLLLTEEEVHRTNLAKFIGYLFAIRNVLSSMGKNEKIVEKLLDEFAYYLLVKNLLDAHIINYVSHLTVFLYKQTWIKVINKYFIIKFMEEVVGLKLDEYFILGQELRSKIYGLVQEQKGISLEKADNKQKNEIIEDAEKIIDRFAKDLRNEELPEYFAETFERDIVWLKSRGLRISKDLSERFAKLIYDLKTSDLSKFYLIKASVILGLLSPVSKTEEELSEEVE